ncbi:MAG: PBSX family phage terminase large subunit [Oscillospiraceae bacterium]|nr:PBSX family phage terminase large subunit [Oscillospiraceae bacterium]
MRELSQKQLRVLTWWCDSSPERDRDAIICDGAVRSGKTLIMSLSFVIWAMVCFEGRQFGMCGKTIASLRRNVIQALLPMLRELGMSCEEKVSKNILSVEFAGRENTFHLFGGRDESSAALIQGVTLAGVLFDEVALQPRSFVEQAIARCSVTGSRFWFNCNPEGPEHWFYREWVCRTEDRRALYLHFTMDDNPSLDPAVRDRYERLYSGVFYKRYVLGQWVAAEGLVYDFFDGSYVKPVPESGMEEYCISCDYGTANPSSFGLWGRSKGVWYRIKEYYFDSRREGHQKTDAEYAEDLVAFAEGLPLRAVVVDPSAASCIETLRRLGLNVVKAKNDVLSGIRTAAGLLKSGAMVICEPCRDAIREFSLYVWADGAKGDMPRKENDHAMDEIRYFASTIVSPGNDDFAVVSVRREI